MTIDLNRCVPTRSSGGICALLALVAAGCVLSGCTGLPTAATTATTAEAAAAPEPAAGSIAIAPAEFADAKAALRNSRPAADPASCAERTPAR